MTLTAAEYEALTQRLAAAEQAVERGQTALRAEQEKLERAEAKLRREQQENRLLREKIELILRQKYGPSSEKLTTQQLSLLEEEPGVTQDEVDAEAGRGPLPETGALPEPQKKVKRKHPGRRPLPDHLPRVEKVLACAAADCVCGACGNEMPVIGYDTSETLEVKPPEYWVAVTKREKRACRCVEGRIRMAPLAPRILPKSVAGDSLVIETVVAKYADHVPLYRQDVILARDVGLEIGRATMDGWVMAVGEYLIAIVQAMRRELLAEPYLQGDETTVRVLLKNKSGAAHTGYLWQYGKPGGSVVFDFRMGRDAGGPRAFLRGYRGILQTDGYQAYEKVGAPECVHIGCWTHARRGFAEALKATPEYRRAVEMLVRYDALFRIDAEARAEGLDALARHQRRQELSLPLVAEIRRECELIQAAELPKSLMAQAAGYTLNQWTKLRACFDHPLAELSNNLAENSMRGVALGRKNWLHVGHELAAPKVAAILSVVESCRRLRLPVREYLAAVLPGLDRRSAVEVALLTPAHWAARR